MNRIVILLVAVLGVFLGGCVIAAKLGTPTKEEQVVNAEFDLTNYNHGKLLIVVKSYNDDRDSQKLCYYLDKTVRAVFVSNKIMPESSMIDYSLYADYKNSLNDINRFSAIEIGQTLGADTVLEITIKDLKFGLISGSGFYDGSVKLSGTLYNVNSETAIWPGDGFAKEVNVGFDVDSNGYEGALKRLAKTGGHCITRYLYDCPLLKFKIREENSDSQW